MVIYSLMPDTCLTNKYEAVIGLEVHARLLLKSKLFSSESAAYGDEPNTNVSVITLGHPGTLPKTNKRAIEFAVKTGLACNCEIEHNNHFARKNYFYPDLPKGFQTTQHTAPICKGGHITISTSTGTRDVKLNRIHLEEDAGKSLHDVDENYTCIDLNRAGTALIEIVSEPDIFSAEEAYQYLYELRRLVRWIGVCDGNMEEGSLRCDANVSVRLAGDTALGTKVEIKNLNSLRNVKRAIEYEVDRMVEILENGNTISQQTRSFDASTDTTFPLREKEEANDYRYFPEPDLPPFYLTDPYIAEIRNSLPALPHQLIEEYSKEFGLTEYDAAQLCTEKETSDYFQLLIQHTTNYKAVANWLNGPVRQYLNANKLTISQLNLPPETFAELINLTESGKVSFSAASSKLFHALILSAERNVYNLAMSMDLIHISDSSELENWVDNIIAKIPDKVAEYKRGKKGLMGLFVGEVKKLSKGKADPKIVTELFHKKLS